MFIVRDMLTGDLGDPFGSGPKFKWLDGVLCSNTVNPVEVSRGLERKEYDESEQLVKHEKVYEIIELTSGSGDEIESVGDPAYDAVNDRVTKTTVKSDGTIAKHKIKKLKQLAEFYAQKIAAGRLHNGHVYQIRDGSKPGEPDDQKNFMTMKIYFAAGAVSPHGGTWRDMANVNVSLDDAAMEALCDDVKTYVMALIRQASTHKDGIKACSTHSQISQYDIAADWPTNE